MKQQLKSIALFRPKIDYIAVNITNNKVIKEFREVYNALDKDYITSIVANVKAIEKTVMMLECCREAFVGRKPMALF